MPDARLQKFNELLAVLKENGDMDAFVAAVQDAALRALLAKWVTDYRAAKLKAKQTKLVQNVPAPIMWSIWQSSTGRYVGGATSEDPPPLSEGNDVEVVTSFNFDIISSDVGEENPAFSPVRDLTTGTWRDSTAQERLDFKLFDEQEAGVQFSHEVDRTLSERVGFDFHGKKFPLSAMSVRDILFAIAAFNTPGHVHAFVEDMNGDDFEIDTKTVAEHLLQHAVAAYWDYRKAGRIIRQAVRDAQNMQQFEQARDKRLD